MAKTVKEAYGEIVRLRNEAYKKWMETPTDDEYNRVVTKAKFQAYEKCMEQLTPSIVDPQPKESIEYNPFDDFRHTDSEEPVSEDMEAEFLRAAHNLREQPTLSAWFRHFYNLGKQQMIKSAKLSGWVARDENGSLHLFEVEPSRIMHRWWDRDYHSTTLDNKDFPDLEWENEPVYVKLPIIVED